MASPLSRPSSDILVGGEYNSGRTMADGIIHVDDKLDFNATKHAGLENNGIHPNGVYTMLLEHGQTLDNEKSINVIASRHCCSISLVMSHLV